MLKDEHELLQQYVLESSESAFSALVERYTGLVYSTTYRLLGDSQLAEDAVQQVFILFARKSGKLRKETVLSAWLYRAARNIAWETLRHQRRRLQREQVAAQLMNESAPEAVWLSIRPLLEEVLAKLPSSDQEAIVLRCFENKSLKEVGFELGTSEDAAQKKVTRALMRLKGLLARHGITVPAEALGATIVLGAVQSPPSGLAASVALACSKNIMAVGPKSALPYIMSTTKPKLIATLSMLAVLSLTVAFLIITNASLKRQLDELRQHSLSPAQMDLASSTAPQISLEELERLRREHQELMILRGRLAQLTRERQQTKASENTGSQRISTNQEQTDIDSVVFSAALTNSVTSGQSLVFGGWLLDGKRSYLLLTPVMSDEAGGIGQGKISFEARRIAAPESFWESLGWGAARSEKRRSSLSGVLTPEQVDALLGSLKEDKLTVISNPQRNSCNDGENISFAWSRAAGDGGGLLMAIDVYPRIVDGGASVEIGVVPSSVPSEVRVDPSFQKP